MDSTCQLGIALFSVLALCLERGGLDLITEAMLVVLWHQADEQTHEHCYF